VWRDDHVALDSAGAPLPPACVEQLALLSASGRLRLVSGDLQLNVPTAGVRPYVVVSMGFFVPRYWGPALVAPAPGLLPPLAAPPLFLPPLRPPLGGLPFGVTRVGGPAPIGLGGPPVVDKDGRVWAVLAVIAIVVLPAVAVGLAASRPEDSERNAEAIDQANAYNDWLRAPGAPCAVVYEGGS
jgi:hypothetical protein